MHGDAMAENNQEDQVNAAINTAILVDRNGTGSSPRIRPRPQYPSFATIGCHFLDIYLIKQCLLGALLVQWLAPWYRSSRSFARENDVDDRWYFTAVLCLVHTGLYLGVNLPYFVRDTYQVHQSLKLFRKPSMQASRNQLSKLALDQVIGQLIVSPISAYVAFPILFQPLLLGFDSSDSDGTATGIPSVAGSFLQLLFCLLANDTLFYVMHRLLHSKWLYKSIHKQHHEFVGAVSYAAEYAHPLEGLLANQLPTVSGLFVWRMHPLCFFIWIGLRLQETYETHSGYRSGSIVFGKDYQVAHHDFHHSYNQGNFGAFYLDWMFGTMDHYQAMSGYEGYLKLKSS
ncbi:Fatty acid hydroxylase domain-containing protein 2 [Seminavis robusta]|uniref:Fatty acid hydroxylase domain-containing protein 2 n=1 Tax=Seminavis robusta TaxID=568900 RepID=A0A9N8DF85_9STRA|nr:Fatty acid hydroxylase domain-containing protein 2 [Seminavis robusta]|eukprot:Sro60_g034830.1 Fatty acid hydroxylase domain-containing protein 2 (343) ;mRNA; f:119889-121027